MRVRLEEVRFAYGDIEVIAGLSLELPEGRTTVVIGPSGSGKSTLARLLAGLLHPAGGRLTFDGSDVGGLPAERRDVGMVFQSYALFPHLTARDNVAFGLRTARRRRPAAEVAARVAEAAELLGLAPLLDRKPSQLSGGEQQRVALARAIAPRPALLLLDEPLSALDARLRREVRGELSALLRRLGTTVFYVTHDQEEALLLADHLVVLERGAVAQEGEPLQLYRRPATSFVAGFLGEANLLEARVEAASAGPPRLATPLGALAAAGGLAAGTSGRLLLRPEDLCAATGPEEPGVEATVVEARGLGAYDRVVARLAGGEEILLHLAPGSAPAAGARMRLGVAPGRAHFLPE